MLDRLERIVAGKIAQHKAARAEFESASSEYETASQALDLIREAVADSTSRLREVERTVTLILGRVFHSDMRFEIESTESNSGEPGINLYVHDGPDRKLANRFGGAVQHTVDIALRVAVALYHPNAAPYIICDEAVATYDDDDRMRALVGVLDELGRQCGFQIIMVSHDAIFDIGNVVRVTKSRYWATVENVG